MRDAGGTLRTMARIRMRDAGNVLRTITRIRMRDADGVLRIVYDPTGSSTLVANVDQTSRQGLTNGTGTATTNTVTASGANGTAPYTYAWTLLNYDHPTVAPTANSPTSAATTFTQTSIGVAEVYTSTWRVTVTDAASNTATADVIANFADVS